MKEVTVKYYSFLIVLICFCYISESSACDDSDEPQVTMQKSEVQPKNCLEFILIYPKKVGLLDDVKISVDGKDGAEHVAEFQPKINEYNSEKYYSNFCFSKSVLKGAEVLLYYSIDNENNGTRTMTFCGVTKEITNLVELWDAKDAEVIKKNP